MGRPSRLPVFDYLLLKTAARCNIACSYCYWFRDRSVLDRPKVLTLAAEAALMKRLEAHIVEHDLTRFSILFHGGEPLLLGKRRFIPLLDALRDIENRTGCPINLSITTNGLLVDDDWASVMRVFEISPTVSLDGPATLHDRYRVTHSGRPTFDGVLAGIEVLRRHGIEPGILAVCQPDTDPHVVTEFLVEDLGARHFDVLVPDATHEDEPRSIASYYTRLFDLWFDDYGRRGVDVRYVRAILTNLLGGDAHLESIGYGPIQTVAMLTDGALEPLDVLRIAGDRSTQSERSVFTHTFQDVLDDPCWRRAYESALSLPQTCQECEYVEACGGGFLPHRFSEDRGYDNPSVYCDDLKQIFAHIWRRAAPDVYVVDGDERFSLFDLAA